MALRSGATPEATHETPIRVLSPQAQRGTRKAERRTWSTERRQAIAGYLFVAPAMVIFFVFTLLPVGIAAYLSFTNYDVFTKLDWIGTTNYEDVFQDELFWRALWNTAAYTLWSVPLS